MKQEGPARVSSNNEESASVADDDQSNRHEKEGALETVRHVLKIAGLNPEPLMQGTGFTVSFEDPVAPKVTGVAQLFEDDRRFIFYMEIDEHAPEVTRPQLAEFITRANYGLSIGNFELDYSNGTLRFKSAIDYADSELPAVFVRNAILAAMDAVEIYAPAAIEVMKGNVLPKEAIGKVEGGME